MCAGDFMVEEKIVDAVKAARKGAKKRNFRQSFDIAVNLKNVDLKKPEEKVKTEVTLPNPVDKKIKIGVFANVLIPQVKKYAEDVVLITKDEIEKYGKDRKAARALANSCIAFVAEAPLMPQVARRLGPVLAVRGKMPKPVPPTIKDIGPVLKRAKSSVKLATKDTPVVHCRIGTEGMDDEKVAENASTVIDAVTTALPKGKDQIKNVYIKVTMGKAVKVKM